MPKTGKSNEEMIEQAIDISLTRMRLVGYDKFRLSDVARCMGVSHAALYPHFDNKTSLINAAIERWLSHVEKTVAAVAVSLGDPKDRILEFLVKLYQTKRAKALVDPEPHRAFNVAMALHKPFVIAYRNRLIGHLANLFTEAGPAIGGNPNANAKLIYNVTAAFHHPTLIEQTAQDNREQQLRQIVKLTILGMAQASGADLNHGGRREDDSNIAVLPPVGFNPIIIQQDAPGG